MLKHERPEDKIPSTAAEMRVTAQEFAEAVSAAQARKEEEARRREETIPIGEAVQELDLEVTPEEILEQVIAKRAAQSGTPSNRRGIRWLVGLFDRYRPSMDRAQGRWQPTGERFIDPSSRRTVEVYYNPDTGERDYRELLP